MDSSFVAAGRAAEPPHVRRRLAALLVLTVALLAGSLAVSASASAATYVVNSANDGSDLNPGDGICSTGTGVPVPPSGNPECTLRAAIQSSNAVIDETSNPTDRISFDLTGFGACDGSPNKICPTGVLPELSDTVTIDGYTQPGSEPNTASRFDGTNADIGVELSGVYAGASDPYALYVAAPDVTIRGLAVNGFDSEIYLGGVEAPGARIVGNFLGTDRLGNAVYEPVGNGYGVTVDSATDGAIGGVADADRNLISGNAAAEILIAGGQENLVEYNLIGTTPSGETGVANASHGVQLLADTSRNGIALNTISGNLGHGVWAVGGADNEVWSNRIGVTDDGEAPLGNGLRGVRLSNSSGNRIGDGGGNVISANGGNGVEISGESADDNSVRGNRIGTSGDGEVDLGNAENGVHVFAGSSNTIGGAGSGEGNVLSGNGGNGLLVNGGATDTSILGNRVGTDDDGQSDLGNTGTGVTVAASPFEPDGSNFVGGAGDGQGNLVSGNDGNGIALVSSRGVYVEGNRVGTDAVGEERIANTADGILLNGSNNNRAGGVTPGVGNLVSGNGGNGIALVSSSSFNVVADSRIGVTATGAPRGNSGDGVHVGADGPSRFNTIGATTPGSDQGNTIAHNRGRGVRIASGTAHSVISNSIDANGGLGIDLVGGVEQPSGVTANDEDDPDSGPNDLQNHPVITEARNGASGTTIEGTLNSVPDNEFEVELFASPAADPSGHGEGRMPIGSARVRTNSEGDATFSRTVPAVAAGSVVTALAHNFSTADSSEFSAARGVSAAADLSISKSGPSGSVPDGEPFDYTLVARNAGPDAGEDVVVRDDLPDGLDYDDAGSDARCSPDPSLDPNDVRCELGTLARGGSESITVRATPNRAGTFTNVATITGSTFDEDDADNRATESTTVFAQADLSIVKSGPATADRDSEFDYRLEVTNSGPSDATNVKVVDILPGQVEYLSASGDGSCSESSGFVNCDLGTVAEGATETITLRVRARSSGDATNVANVYSDDVGDPDSSNNNAEPVTTRISTTTDLSLDKSAPATATVGDRFDYVLRVRNAGPSRADFAGVEDELPAGLDFVSASSGSCDYSSETREVRCQLSDLAVGEERTIRVRVRARSAGEKVNTARVSAGTDQDGSDNEDSATTLVAPAPEERADLSVDGSSPSSVAEGQRFAYTFRARNAGPDAARGAILRVTLSAGQRFVAASAGCSYARATRRLTCDLRTIGRGGEKARGVTVEATDPGPLTARGSVSSRADDPRPADNAETESVTVRPPPSGRPRCTIVGTSGNDVIEGTRGDDVICAGAGNDVVRADRGDDVVYGGADNDALRGNEGDDRLYGEGGADAVNSSDGVRANDLVDGGAGANACNGDPGDRRRRCS